MDNYTSSVVKKANIWDNFRMNLKPFFAGVMAALAIFILFIVFTRLDIEAIMEPESEIIEQRVDSLLLRETGSFEDLTEYMDTVPGNFGLYIYHLPSGLEYAYQPDTVFFAASLYKIVVGGAVYDMISSNKISLSYTYSYEPSDYADGAGVIREGDYGETYTLDELLDYLLKYSDNVAQNILIRNISREKVVDFYNYLSPEGGTMFVDQTSTPRRISNLLVSIYNNKNWSRDLRRDFFVRMIDTEFETRIPPALSSGLIFSHKIGNWPEDTWHDCGIVFDSSFDNPTVVCLMSTGATFENFVDVSRSVGSFINDFY